MKNALDFEQKLLEIYSHFFFRILSMINIRQDINYYRLKIFNLIKNLSFKNNKIIFRIFDQQLYPQIFSLFIFIFGEMNEDQDEFYNQDGQEVIQVFIQYFLYRLASQSKVSVVVQENHYQFSRELEALLLS